MLTWGHFRIDDEVHPDTFFPALPFYTFFEKDLETCKYGQQVSVVSCIWFLLEEQIVEQKIGKCICLMDTAGTWLALDELQL